MTSPETPEGKDYWNKLYQKAGELFGLENITIPTLTRPWIVPDEIIVRESTDSTYIYKATLKVILEQDYLKDNALYSFKDERLKALNEYSSQLIRETIIPKLTKEINTSKRYAALRQVFYSLILAQWFKARQTGKDNPYSWRINNKDLTNLLSQTPYSIDTYFKAYKDNFEKGEYNIKEPAYTPYGQVIRSYFSGGITIMPADTPYAQALNLPLGEQSKTTSLIPTSLPTGKPKKGEVEVQAETGPGGELRQVKVGGLTTPSPDERGEPLSRRSFLEGAAAAITAAVILAHIPGAISAEEDSSNVKNAKVILLGGWHSPPGLDAKVYELTTAVEGLMKEGKNTGGLERIAEIYYDAITKLMLEHGYKKLPESKYNLSSIEMERNEVNKIRKLLSGPNAIRLIGVELSEEELRYSLKAYDDLKARMEFILPSAYGLIDDVLLLLFPPGIYLLKHGVMNLTENSIVALDNETLKKAAKQAFTKAKGIFDRIEHHLNTPDKKESFSAFIRSLNNLKKPSQARMQEFLVLYGPQSALGETDDQELAREGVAVYLHFLDLGITQRNKSIVEKLKTISDRIVVSIGNDHLVGLAEQLNATGISSHSIDKDTSLMGRWNYESVEFNPRENRLTLHQATRIPRKDGVVEGEFLSNGENVPRTITLQTREFTEQERNRVNRFKAEFGHEAVEYRVLLRNEESIKHRIYGFAVDGIAFIREDILSEGNDEQVKEALDHEARELTDKEHDVIREEQYQGGLRELITQLSDRDKARYDGKGIGGEESLPAATSVKNNPTDASEYSRDERIAYARKLLSEFRIKAPKDLHWLEGREHPNFRAILNSLFADDILFEIPVGSTILSYGFSSVVLRMPDGNVLRIGRDTEQKRLDIKGLLQPTSAKIVGNYLLEILPFVNTTNFTNDEVKDLERLLNAQGYTFDDYALGQWDNDNLGRLPNGEVVVIDPGAVGKLTGQSRILKELENYTTAAVTANHNSDVFAPQIPTDSRKGGIDFRYLPIVTQAISNLRVDTGNIPLSRLNSISLDSEWQQIERLVNSGIMPSTERIKEFVQASAIQGEIDMDMSKVVLCIADIFRLEEERCSYSDPALKDILIVLESGRSAQELKEVFVAGII